MHKKSEIISVKKVLILTADLSPKWWVGTSDRTGQNFQKLVHSLIKSGHDRKKNEGKNGETKDIKVQKMHKKSEIISVKKVLILTADLSPKWLQVK